ncbi:MAG: family 10 glycosylhydrolase [Thermoplasmatota archaeon]
MMRPNILISVSIFLVLSSAFTISSSSHGNSKIPAIDAPSTDYPQQDGGSDERLFQYRSMWMDGYQIVNISEVRAAIRFARENGFNCVSPNINGHYLGVFYDSQYFPKYPEVHWSFDPLMELIKEAHKYNIHVMPWFHTMYNYPALREHPEWRDRTSSGGYSSYWMDPANPEVRSFLVNLTGELFENYPLDGIKLDTIRYGGSYMGYTEIAIQKYYDEGWTNFNDFRRNQITEVVELLYGTVMGIRPWAWVGADIWHQYSSWYSYVFQDSRTWASRGIIDFVTTMSYTTSVSYFTSNLDDNLRNFNCEVVAGPYVYVPGNTAHGSVPDEETGISILLQQTQAAIQMGSLGTCMFAYKFLREFPAYARALRDGPFSEPALCPLKKQRIPVDERRWEFERDHDTEGWRTTSMGQFYPVDGKWSAVDVKRPGFMSPLLSFNHDQINVVEIMMKSEGRTGNISIHWSLSRPVFSEEEMVRVDVADTGEWKLYSIHMDSSSAWNGGVGYLWIVPRFPEETNITIDWIRITWMPYCIRDWAFIGPFFSGERERLLDREFIPNEGNPLPRIGDVAGGRDWTGLSLDRDQVDLAYSLGEIRDAVIFSHVYIRSGIEEVVQLRHGNADGARIWLNGLEIFLNRDPRGASPDQNITYVVLRKGINTLMLKQAVYGDDSSFFVRFTTLDNRSVEDLEYFGEIPPLGKVSFSRDPDKWSSTDSPKLSWAPPVNDIGLDHFQYSLDEDPPVNISGTELLFDGLSNGIHRLSVRCVDNIGFPGLWQYTRVKVDTEVPAVSRPASSETSTRDDEILWNWTIENDPVSGIAGCSVDIGRARFGSGDIKIIARDIPVDERSFRFKDELWNGYVYYLTVKVVTGSGLGTVSQISPGVIVDKSPPIRPAEISIEQVQMGSREYLITWTESVENLRGGIEHYEVWMKVGSGEWHVLTTTNATSLVVERPLGVSISVKVRAKDRTGLFSTFTDVVHTVNQPPRPAMLFPEEMVEGAPIEITLEDNPDPDGILVLRRWFVDDVLVSSEDHLMMTFFKGSYKITVWVMDDQGEQVQISRVLDILGGGKYNPDGSLSEWLERSSVVMEEMPPVEVVTENNRTVQIDGTDDDKVSSFRNVLADGFIMIATISLMVLIAALVFFVVISEILDKGMPAPEDREETMKETPLEQRRRLMESLYVRSMARRMVESEMTKGSGIAPPMDKGRFLRSSGAPLAHYGAGMSRSESDEIENEDWDSLEEWDEIEEVGP